MPVISFSLDQFRLPRYEVNDRGYEALGVWLTSDISRYFLTCLDALAMVDDVTAGRPPFEEWSSDKFEVLFTPKTVSLQNLWLDHQRG